MARKKIPYADASTGETVKPTENTGIKLESFIFDVFPKADKLVAFEVRAVPAVPCFPPNLFPVRGGGCPPQVERATDFSPLKNKEGADSPASARDILCALHRRWLTAAGAEIQGDASSSVEVSPLVSAFGDNLSVFRGASLQAPLLVATKGEPLPAGEAAHSGEGPVPGVSVTQLRCARQPAPLALSRALILHLPPLARDNRCGAGPGRVRSTCTQCRSVGPPLCEPAPGLGPLPLCSPLRRRSAACADFGGEASSFGLVSKIWICRVIVTRRKCGPLRNSHDHCKA